MAKRNSKLDLIAAVLLVGTVTTMVVAQVLPPPVPVQQPCPGGVFTFPDGTTVPYDAMWCPWDKRCAVAGTFVAPNFYFVQPYCAPAPA